MENSDEQFMRLALSSARKGIGLTSPNPMVGAVVVSAGRVVGRGWYRGPGNHHAEREALDRAGAEAKGSTLYVSLEPCNHFGRTPPCTTAIIDSGIERVVAAMVDPDPLVTGHGFQALKESGIEIEVGTLERQARRLNEAYLLHRTLGRPFVTYKAAASLDGGIAAADGSSKWITSGQARSDTQKLRAASDAICVGIGTVLADDPELTVRELKTRKTPLRVIVDSGLRVPVTSKVASGIPPTLIVTVGNGRDDAYPPGVEVLRVPAEEGRVSLKSMLENLASRGVVSLLLEGGGDLAGAFAARNLIDKYIFHLAPKLLGSDGTRGALSSWAAASISDAKSLEIESVKMLGPDLRVIAYPTSGGR